MEQQRTIWTVIVTVVVAVLVVVSIMAFQSVKEGGNKVIDPIGDIVPQDYEPNEALEADLSSLPAIKEGHYALWAVDSGNNPLLIWQFRIDSQGFIVDLNNLPQSSVVVTPGVDLTTMQSFFVSLEKGDIIASEPSSSVILSTTKKTKNSHALAFPHDFSAVGGSYILATPTNGANTQETAGVWFVNVENDTDLASLNLPASPAGWVYQGWVLYQSKPLNIGRFNNVAGKDSFSNFSGPRSFPAFPGEDFLTNAPANLNLKFPLNLADGQGLVMVTLEPVVAVGSDLTSPSGADPTGEDIFALTLLQSQIPKDLEARVSTSLNNVFKSPTGSIKVLTR